MVWIELDNRWSWLYTNIWFSPGGSNALYSVYEPVMTHTDKPGSDIGTFKVIVKRSKVKSTNDPDVAQLAIMGNLHSKFEAATPNSY